MTDRGAANALLLHAIRTLDPARGGPVANVRRLTSLYPELQLRGEVVALERPGTAWAEGWPCAVHGTGPGWGRFGWSPGLRPWLRANLARYDGVLVHGLWQHHGLVVRAECRRRGVPYYVFPHGMLDPWFRRAHPGKHFKKLIYWWLVERRVLRDAAAVIFTAQEELELAQGTFPRPRWNPVVIPLGAPEPPGDPEHLREVFFQEHPELRGRRILLFLGRVDPKKGCEMLLEAFRREGGPLHLVVAGPVADRRYAARLRAMAAGLDVTFIGFLSGERLWGALAAAEVFILPSHQENFGVAVAEALASGVPVLISQRVNIWREIEGAGAGLAEPDDVEGTARLIRRWLGADAVVMRAAARNCYRARFDIRRTAENIVRLVQARGG
jgi:glycosyltransferase involved in cell wall biosynthesis